ncbi:MAG: ABC transporter permease [Bacteroidia bacterium]|nr:ABC transporter permease [Bacteroidia bacterium]
MLRTGSIRNATSGPVVNIALTGIVLGIVAMLISIMVVTGFRNEITRKVTGFVAHFRISSFNNNESFEESPIKIEPKTLNRIKSLPEVRQIQGFTLKAALIKTDDDCQGVVLKGVGNDFDSGFFSSKITEGKFPVFNDSSYSTSVLISEHFSKKLRLKTGDSFLVFFIQNDKKVRKVTVSGIYKTGLSEEFDNLYMICDLRMLQQINGWKNGEVGGYEVFLKDGVDMEKAFPPLYNATGYTYNTQSAEQLYPQLFNWLELQNLNVYVIIGLITLVAGITIISTLLILVLEHAREIGLFKAMGATDSFIGSIYGYIALKILLKGIIIANVISFAFAIFQQQTGIITLPEESYYLSKVPVNIDLVGILIVNSIVLLTGMLVMLLPAKIISGIQPVKVLRFD